MGDFLITGDINESIKNRLKNVKLDKECIEKALPEQLDDVIMNLNKDEFIKYHNKLKTFKNLRKYGKQKDLSA